MAVKDPQTAHLVSARIPLLLIFRRHRNLRRLPGSPQESRRLIQFPDRLPGSPLKGQ
jgi:hypothetical protein